MRKIVFAALAALIATPAAASDKADIVKVLHTFLEAKPDVALKTCDTQTGIVDEFPPHAWNSCSDWFHDLEAFNTKNKITDDAVKLGEAEHVDVSGDHAYAVFPAEYDYKLAGKPMMEKGSVWTAALRKTKTGWLITGWAWTKR